MIINILILSNIINVMSPIKSKKLVIQFVNLKKLYLK